MEEKDRRPTTAGHGRKRIREGAKRDRDAAAADQRPGDRSPGGGWRAWWAIAPLMVAIVLVMALLAAGPVASGPVRPQLAAAGGGAYEQSQADEMSEAERGEIEAMIAANIDRLAAAGQLPATRSTARVALGWPLTGRDGFTDPGYHAVTGFVDHGAGYPNQLLDYACGGRTYDSYSGYNHQGTDFYLWPFAWNKMAAGDVKVVAAAGGVIVGRIDGNQDQSCTFNSSRWNAVYVRHADGSVAWYGHLKRGSVTAKGVGATVAAGEYLGVVGSSGNSTGPHLHFELYAAGQLADPYAGSCNPIAGGSWWASQPNYYDSAVNKLTTGSGPVSWGSCPNPDVTNEATQFQPGDRITFSAYYRDQLNNQSSYYRIIAPDGSIFVQWPHTASRAHYTLSYWWWSYDFPVDVMTGTWRFEVDYNGKTYRHTFNVGAPSTVTPVATPATTPSVTPTATPPSTGDLPAGKTFVPLMLADSAP